MSSWWTIEDRVGAPPILRLRGSWRMRHLPEILNELAVQGVRPLDRAVIDASGLEEIDTAGAEIFLGRLLHRAPDSGAYEFREFSESAQNILALASKRGDRVPTLRATNELGMIAQIGKGAIEWLGTFRSSLGFFGEAAVEVVKGLLHPGQIRWRELFVQLETSGIGAIPIVSLVTFLIGIVIAYLFGIQIEKYGANILIVNGVSIAMCRELSPILVAILIAGRSGSAFTAQIGTMKLNEEIDAMRTLGLSPQRVLVVPRVLALVLTMPLLVFVGDVMGILGSMVIADLRLGITGSTFLDRLHTVLPERSFYVGLIKAPVFAVVVAIIGCRMGFSVENNARSVGINTTSTVVQSIVAVILLNAGFAILFQELKF